MLNIGLIFAEVTTNLGLQPVPRGAGQLLLHPREAVPLMSPLCTCVWVF